MSEKLNRLKELLGEVSDLGRAAAVLSWDQQVNMPPMGGEGRGQQRATLSKIIQEKFTSDEVGKLLDDLKQEFAGADADNDDAAMIRAAARDYDKAKCVPPEFVAERSVAAAKGFGAWREAKAKSDFSIFLPHLQKNVELVRKYVEFFPPADHPYDTLLDDYEPGMKTSEVKEIFDGLRKNQVKLIKAVAGNKQVKSDFLFKKYNDQKLWDFGVNVITRFGYDMNRGRQDKAPHPFATSFNVNDVRITTRFVKENPFSTLFGTMHEAGHAMYEQGVDPKYERTALEGGTSLAIHESQSRMWENLVGRSMPFWEYFYPTLKKTFSSQLDGVSLKAFYKAINRVQPSLIRVEADEATYNLHIMLRLELEIAMVEGSIDLKDLPEIWNTPGIIRRRDTEIILHFGVPDLR
jgi:carboxypeptidase Taq